MNRQGLGFLGSIVLLLGVFMPIVSAPIVGQMNYFQNGRGDGTIVLVLAAISAIAVAAKKFGALWYTGGATLAMLAFTFYNFQSKMSAAKSEMDSSLEGNPFGGLAEAMIGSVQLQWGWAVMVVGAILLLVAAQRKDPGGA